MNPSNKERMTAMELKTYDKLPIGIFPTPIHRVN